MVITGHQLNFLPGLSVIEKIRAADCCVWMDEMQFERHAWVNRNRLSDGTMMTIPIAEADHFQPINRVRIADVTGRARKKVARTLVNRLGVSGAPFAAEIERPYRLLAGLNHRLLQILLGQLDVTTEQHFQSHLGAGRYEATSEGLAEMVAELGGDVWLSGPSGRNYLDERPFSDRGILVDYFDWPADRPNPSSVELVRQAVAA